jgi:hypothetical protein
MILTCKVCGTIVTSVLLDKTEALQQAGTYLMQHIQQKHKLKAQKLAVKHLEAITIMMWYLMMLDHASWDDQFITDEFDKWTGKFKQLLGFEKPVETECQDHLT